MSDENTAVAEVDTDPFEMPPRDPAKALGIGALCLHGLTGTPYEVRSIAEELADRGMHCRGPMLAGHGGTPEALAKTTYLDWLGSARDVLSELRRDFNRVVVVGMSMGGLVSLLLAAEDRPNAVVSIGAPLRFSPVLRALIPVAKYVYPYRPKRDGSDIRDDAARARHPGLKSMPLASVHELMRMQRVVEDALPRITGPIMVAHGALDHTANPKDARTIFGSVNSDVRELNIYERSGHIVPVDIDREALASDVGDFLSAHCRQ